MYAVTQPIKKDHNHVTYFVETAVRVQDAIRKL